MNKAGRIGFVIRDDYSATETYDFLDVVYYNGASYVAKKLTTGNTPQYNDEYWHILVDVNGSDISDETPTFTESATRVNINSNEKISILFGKIKKWYTDLKAVAFSGSYNDLSDTPSIPAAVAVKGDLETNYRTGNVNLTKANIGLGNVPNVATNDQTPTYTQATTRANLTSGEKLSISLGKIMKFFADLKTVAFSGSYNDLSNKPTIPAAVAVKGNAESSYRTGNVNLTPANIGAVPTANVLDSKESITANTASGNVAGALGTKEINANLQSQIDTLNSNLGNITTHYQYYNGNELTINSDFQYIDIATINITLPGLYIIIGRVRDMLMQDNHYFDASLWSGERYIYSQGDKSNGIFELCFLMTYVHYVDKPTTFTVKARINYVPTDGVRANGDIAAIKINN